MPRKAAMIFFTRRLLSHSPRQLFCMLISLPGLLSPPPHLHPADDLTYNLLRIHRSSRGDSHLSNKSKFLLHVVTCVLPADFRLCSSPIQGSIFTSAPEWFSPSLVCHLFTLFHTCIIYSSLQAHSYLHSYMLALYISAKTFFDFSSLLIPLLF